MAPRCLGPTASRGRGDRLVGLSCRVWPRARHRTSARPAPRARRAIVTQAHAMGTAGSGASPGPTPLPRTAAMPLRAPDAMLDHCPHLSLAPMPRPGASASTTRNRRPGRAPPSGRRTGPDAREPVEPRYRGGGPTASTRRTPGPESPPHRRPAGATKAWQAAPCGIGGLTQASQLRQPTPRPLRPVVGPGARCARRHPELSRQGIRPCSFRLTTPSPPMITWSTI